ncbi:Lysophospholipase L1 [Rhizobiales bacterium GAS188]|nr:Lysophospholipase L1 [Rhizobiales bacterium GAS188]
MSRVAVVVCALIAGAFLHPDGSRATSDAGAPATGRRCGPAPSIGALTRLGLVGRKLQKLMPIRILAIGSSSTQGIGASSAGHTYPARLEAGLRTRWPQDPLSVVNAGIGGETVAATVDRLERQLATQRFDLVIWQLGTNDAISGDDPEAFRSLVLRGVTAAHAAGVDLVMLDPQYFPGIRDLERYERFVAIIKAIGDDQHVPVFRRYAMMKRWSAQGEADLLAALASDHFHMNDKGYACLAEALTNEIGRMAEPSTFANEASVAVSASQ